MTLTLPQEDGQSQVASLTFEPYTSLFARAVRTWPDKLALIQGDVQLTYDRLDNLTTLLAHRLREQGVREGSPVGLCFPRSAEWVIGTLAIFKAGAVVVALDPVNPDARLAAMVRDARPVVTMAGAPQAARLPEGLQILPIHVAEEPTTDAGMLPAVTITPDSISHLIYTSGSTGTPKAVRERHGAVANLVGWTMGAYSVMPGDRASWMSTPGFAVQIMEWLPYLPLGAAICIPSDGQAQTPEQIRTWLLDQRITHTMLVAALAERVWQLPWPDSAKLRIMVTTAERVYSWPPQDTAFRVVMTYGTTETTNALTCFDLARGIDFTSQATSEHVRAERQVPVGAPIANVNAYILDEDGDPVDDEVIGRLHISGAGVAAGYHERDELTAAVFRPNPMPDDPYPVLYDTGDQARRRPDGAIELIGRVDHQVKIRGFRVEIGEVEEHLRALPGVIEAVVTVDDSTEQGKRLIAYVVTDSVDADGDGLRAVLTKRLPYYMVPSALVFMDALPRLANGKIDRSTLPPAPAVANSSEQFETPRNELESEILTVWAALFGGSRIGIHDNFFGLGGHSLMAFRLLDQVRTTYNVELSLSDLAAAPTVARLAALVSENAQQRGARLSGLLIDPGQQDEPFAMTEAQQAMWIGRHDLLDLGNVGCHGYFEWESADLDIERFTQAWRKVVHRHASLRTIVLPSGQQQVLDEIIDPRHLDLTDMDEPTRQVRLLDLRDKLANRVLDEVHGPLYDVLLTRLPGGMHRIHMSVDFLVADAWSYFQVIVPDLESYYDESADDPAPLELTFRDYVIAMQGPFRETAQYERSRWYWMDRLEQLPPAPQLPGRPADAPAIAQRFVHLRHVLSVEEWSALQGRARQHEITASGLLAAVFAEVLGVWSGQRRLTINFPLFNRVPLHPDVNRLCGDMTTTVLIAVDSRGDTFAKRATDIQQRMWSDLAHRHFDGVSVLRQLTKMRGSLVPAMPVVMTSLAGQPPQYREVAFGRPVYGISQTPQVSLDFQIFERDGRLEFNWDYLPSAYPDGLIEEMFGACCRLLDMLRDADTWSRDNLGLVPRTITPPTMEPLTEDVTAARDTGAAWERYWASVHRTGRDGDVIWDADSPDELTWLVETSRSHFDPSLPVIDIGCGNGRYTRAFATVFPGAVGIDVSASAIQHAVAETPAELSDRLTFLVADAVQESKLERLLRRRYNVFVRGVFHVLDDSRRKLLARSIARLTGGAGSVMVHEPAYNEGTFGYTGLVGEASEGTTRLVTPLETAGVRHSRPFAHRDVVAAFDQDTWEIATERTVPLAVVAPDRGGAPVDLPGYLVILHARKGVTAARQPIGDPS